MDARGINSVNSSETSSVSSSKDSRSFSFSNINSYELVNNIRTQLALVQIYDYTRSNNYYLPYRSYVINTSKN